MSFFKNKTPLRKEPNIVPDFNKLVPSTIPNNIVRQAMGLDKPDMVNRPAHYTDSKIEVWDYIIDKNLTYCLGNVVKYVSRAGKKGSPDQHLEDLKKAQAYLKREIERVEAGE